MTREMDPKPVMSEIMNPKGRRRRRRMIKRDFFIGMREKFTGK